MNNERPVCKVCDKGALEKTKMYRMSSPVVIIGWIFLIPSFLGIMTGMLMMLTTSVGAGAALSEETIERSRTVQKTEFEKMEIPAAIISKALVQEELTKDEKAGLNERQIFAIDCYASREGGREAGVVVGATMAYGMSIFLIISSFCGGLLGWLLTMKKKVLLCNMCAAVVASA